MSDGDNTNGTHDDHPTKQPSAPPSSASEMRGRMNTVGVPTEKSKDFSATSKRLFRRLGPERPKAYLVLVLAVVSVALVVSGPKILGHATNLIFEGLVRSSKGGAGIDFGALHTTLWIAVGLYLTGYALAYLQAFVLAGVVQRTMYRLRADVETKLHAMPLSYLDRQARGDLLSRVTNDIDNVAQSMQQSLSQLLQGVLTIAGTIGKQYFQRQPLVNLVRHSEHRSRFLLPLIYEHRPNIPSINLKNNRFLYYQKVTDLFQEKAKAILENFDSKNHQRFEH